jgi:hypothetical protein
VKAGSEKLYDYCGGAKREGYFVFEHFFSSLKSKKRQGVIVWFLC